MTYKEIDFIFPFVIFGYGLIVTLVLNSPILLALGKGRFSQNLMAQFQSHRMIAFASLIIGALWSLQNIWLK
jgi:hypothetical protein